MSVSLKSYVGCNLAAEETACTYSRPTWVGSFMTIFNL